jgi:flagellar assembly factor FliW
MSIKVAAETVLDQETWLKPMEFILPAGLIGFPEANRLELIYNPEELPLMWLRSVDDPALNFLVVEPRGLLPDYAVEISDDDVAQLGLEDSDDTLILNIVNFRPERAEASTVNLIGPIVVNRRTCVGRQIVIANYADYSARHALFAPETAQR